MFKDVMDPGFRESPVYDMFVTIEWREQGMVWAQGQWWDARYKEAQPINYFDNKFGYQLFSAIEEAKDLTKDYGCNVEVRVIEHKVYDNGPYEKQSDVTSVLEFHNVPYLEAA